jgi:hypothetical protein
MNYSLEPGKELTLRCPPGRSSEINISFADGTIIKTTLASRGVINITAGRDFKGMNIDVNILGDSSIGVAD